MSVGKPIRTSFNSAGRTLAGAPRYLRVDQSKGQEKPWLNVPSTWFASALEWYVMWYLTRHGVEPNGRRYRLGRDFFYQKGVAAPGLFANKPFTRADFLLVKEKVILDPYTSFTHPDPLQDLRKRRIVARQGLRLVFLTGLALETDPGPIIELARRGIDVSPLGNRL